MIDNAALIDRVALAIHKAMGNGWAYRNCGGDEWNDLRDTLRAAAQAAIIEVEEFASREAKK